MKKILILNREELDRDLILKKVDDISIGDFVMLVSQEIPGSDIVLFFCSLTGKMRIIKNNGGELTKALEIPTYTSSNEILILSKLIGI